MNALPVIDYDEHPAYRKLPRGNEELRRGVLETFGPLLEAKRRSMAGLMQAVAGRITTSPDATVAELANGGVARLRLPPGEMARLRRVFAPADKAAERRIAEIRSDGRPVKFRDTEIVVHQGGQAVPGMDDLAAAIVKVIHDSGALDVADAYYPGFRSHPHNIAFRRNVADQEFFRVKGAPTPRTAGMHIDSNSGPCLNGIVYLNEVGPDQGPFSYVAGSDRWPFDPEDRAIRKAVDAARIGAGNGRKSFVQLPPEYRRKASFGFDIGDETPMSHALLSLERAYTSDVADMVLFYSDGVHRGGDVTSGHRASILFTLQMTPTKNVQAL